MEGGPEGRTEGNAEGWTEDGRYEGRLEVGPLVGRTEGRTDEGETERTPEGAAEDRTPGATEEGFGEGSIEVAPVGGAVGECTGRAVSPFKQLNLLLKYKTPDRREQPVYRDIQGNMNKSRTRTFFTARLRLHGHLPLLAAVEGDVGVQTGLSATLVAVQIEELLRVLAIRAFKSIGCILGKQQIREGGD